MFPIKRKSSDFEQFSLWKTTEEISLSDEQRQFIQIALSGKNVLVDACIGSGKTTAIQQLCNLYPETKRILYLTYNKLLKLDAKKKIVRENVVVTNYHGFAFGILMKTGIISGYEDSVSIFNEKHPFIPLYDVLIIDEYQDIETELAEMLRYIKACCPNIQIVAVGDMDQKIYDKTSLDVKCFINEYLDLHESLRFTYCFRLSSDISEMLGRVWEKPIVGVNENCVVEKMSLDEVEKFLSEQDPNKVICLGQRRGAMADLLNRLESHYPNVYNKKTVYANIKSVGGGATEPNSRTAIFTTFDSSKGLERPICVVCDWTSDYWVSRLTKPDTRYEILRNIFCVAASRGKNHIIFVEENNPLLTEEELESPIQSDALTGQVIIDEMFNFKYKEDIDYAFSLIDVTPQTKGSAKIPIPKPKLVVKNHDCMIDLLPCIDVFLKEFFFNQYSIDNTIERYVSIERKDQRNYDTKQLSEEEKILYYVSLQTRQDRYRTQVELPFVSENAKKVLSDMLSEKFSADDDIQIDVTIPFCDSNGNKALCAVGQSDVVKENEYFSIKYVENLSHTDFLICACYVLALSMRKGYIWNLYNNTNYCVTIPNKGAFLDAVTNAVTKGKIKKYYHENSIVLSESKVIAVIDTETNYFDEVMSVGIVIADSSSYDIIDKLYILIEPEYLKPSMFYQVIDHERVNIDFISTRENAFRAILELLKRNGVHHIFAYNASFDFAHVPELQKYLWYDIMRIAAYKQYNSFIDDTVECYSSGRMRRGYGAEDIYQMLSGDIYYHEIHNALTDAEDELKIMKMLGLPIGVYISASINNHDSK